MPYLGFISASFPGEAEIPPKRAILSRDYAPEMGRLFSNGRAQDAPKDFPKIPKIPEKS